MRRIKYIFTILIAIFGVVSFVIPNNTYANTGGICANSTQLSMLIAQSAACVTNGGFCTPGSGSYCQFGEMTQYSSSCAVYGTPGTCCYSSPQPGVAAPTIPPPNTPVPTAVASNGMSSSACYSINQGMGPGQCDNSCPTGWAPQGTCNFGGTTCCVPSNSNNGGTSSSCPGTSTCSFSPSCPTNTTPITTGSGANGGNQVNCNYNGQYTGLCCATNQPTPNPPPNPIPTSIQNTPAPTCPPGVLFCNGAPTTPPTPAPTCPPGVLFCNGANVSSQNAPVVINPCNDPSLSGVVAICANGSTPDYSVSTGINCNGSKVYICFTNILKLKSPFSSP